MASFICKCGERLSNTLVPNDIQYWVYSDKEWDKILEKDVYNSWEIPEPKLEVWKCPICERVYIFENNTLIRTYALENE